MQLFFCDNLQGPTAILNEEESRHCKVLRKQIGDEIHVIDGLGALALCRINKIQGKEMLLELINLERLKKSRDYYFHLFIAPTKQNDRIEWMFEKAVEKNRVNISRLERIALSAIKQSAQFYLPKINPLVKLSSISLDGNYMAAHCRDDAEKIGLVEALGKSKNIKSFSILIGPEGDFSPAEIQRFEQKNVLPISLGNNRLRTETAGLYCAMVLNANL